MFGVESVNLSYLYSVILFFEFFYYGEGAVCLWSSKALKRAHGLEVFQHTESEHTLNLSLGHTVTHTHPDRVRQGTCHTAATRHTKKQRAFSVFERVHTRVHVYSAQVKHSQL